MVLGRIFATARRFDDVLGRAFRPAGALIGTWAALGGLLGPGKAIWPRVIGSVWVQIPGSCLRALLLAAAALIAMWQAAHAARRWRQAHAALATLAVLLQLAWAGAHFYGAYEAAFIVLNSLRPEEKRADVVTRLVARQTAAATRGEPLFPSRKHAAFMYRVVGAPSTYREDATGATRVFAPSPAEAAQRAAEQNQRDEERRLIAQMDDLSFQFFRLGCINLGGLGLTALAACIGAARLRRAGVPESTEANVVRSRA